jgi:hypothetical protein
LNAVLPFAGGGSRIAGGDHVDPHGIHAGSVAGLRGADRVAQEGYDGEREGDEQQEARARPWPPLAGPAGAGKARTEITSDALSCFVLDDG